VHNTYFLLKLGGLYRVLAFPPCFLRKKLGVSRGILPLGFGLAKIMCASSTAHLNRSRLPFRRDDHTFDSGLLTRVATAPLPEDSDAGGRLGLVLLDWLLCPGTRIGTVQKQYAYDADLLKKRGFEPFLATSPFSHTKLPHFRGL
jgi:hypothetical protein